MHKKIYVNILYLKLYFILYGLVKILCKESKRLEKLYSLVLFYIHSKKFELTNNLNSFIKFQ